MKNVITNVEVPESLSDLSDSQLRILRDKLIVVGLRNGSVDVRLPRVVEAFQAALRSRLPKARKVGR